MKTSSLMSLRFAGLAGLCFAAAGGTAFAQDWPQWRGPNREARAAEFPAPQTWPEKLTQRWKVTVGEGVATPALVGDHLYVFTREEGREVTRCLAATTGKELWQESYDSLGATGPAQGFSGPRSSPVVADGKVVTVGVRGVLSCRDATTGKLLWRRDDFQAWPNFFVSSSPLIVDGLVVAQLGGRENGALIAYDLASGQEKWRWSGSSPSYASPVVLSVGGTKLIVAQTEAQQLAVTAADGKLVWESGVAGAGQGAAAPAGGRGGRGGGGRDYKATTPAVEGATFITTGRGHKAVKFAASADGFSAQELWSTAEPPAQFASPVWKQGLIFGLSAASEFFCLDAQNGQLLWSAPVGPTRAAAPAPGADRPAAPDASRAAGGPGGRGGGGGMGRMGGGGGGGYGSLVDAGAVLLALTPSAELVVFDPSRQGFTERARFQVADSPTHAYPVVSGNRIFVKDQDAVTLWTLD